MDFRKRLSALLKENNISQQELHRMSGVAQSTISEFLKGKIKDVTTEKA